MDYQGLDHKETYQQDEQEFQNRREYCQQKRTIEKTALAETAFKKFIENSRQKRYGLPEYFDINAVIKGDEELVIEKQLPKTSTKNWIDKYTVKSTDDEPNFQRPIPAAIPFFPTPTILAKLKRTTDKIDNINQMKMDVRRRIEKTTMLQCKQRDKDDQIEKETKVAEKIAQENLEWNAGAHDFEQYFANDYEETLRFYDTLPPMYREKKYPHTLRETNYVKRKLNQSRRQIRDEAKVKSTFLEQINKPKIIKEKDLSADNASMEASELSEQSTDDEDALSIGQKDDTAYQLRGFHYKMGTEIRGKNDREHIRPGSTCITRKEWINELVASSAEHSFFKKNLSSIPNRAAPNDEDYVIFEQLTCPPKPIEVSPIKEMIENENDEPKIINAKVPKIKKPKYIKVKKFSLTGYLFGSAKQERITEKRVKNDEENKYGVSAKMIRKFDGLYDRKRNLNKLLRHNRMKTLGIPIIEQTKTNIIEDEEYLTDSSSGSDWIPENEIFTMDESISKIALARSTNTMVQRKMSYSVTNMRGPMFRESTLQRHPRLKRYPSIRCMLNPMLSEETIQTKYGDTDVTHQIRNDDIFIGHTNHATSQSSFDSRDPYDVPRLSKLQSDLIKSTNLQELRTDFTDLFNSRHHHEHFDCTQHKNVLVTYQPKIPKFKLPPVKKERAAKLKPFQRALPRNGEALNEEMALPKLELDYNSCKFFLILFQ